MLIIVLSIIFLSLHYYFRLPRTDHPFWTRCLLVLEPAIEFPMIFAFHPTSIIYDLGLSSHVPHANQLILQVAGFFTIEIVLQRFILRYVITTPKAAHQICRPDQQNCSFATEHSRQQEAERLMLDFVRPRAALLISVFLLGSVTRLAKFIGRLHPLAMILWMALGQCVDFSKFEAANTSLETHPAKS